MEINIKHPETGEPVKMWLDIAEWQHSQDWYTWREYILLKYPPGLLFRHPGYRAPDREGEVDSFESWKERGKPRPALFNYGELVKDEASKEFTDMIMAK